MIEISALRSALAPLFESIKVYNNKRYEGIRIEGTLYKRGFTLYTSPTNKTSGVVVNPLTKACIDYPRIEFSRLPKADDTRFLLYLDLRSIENYGIIIPELAEFAERLAIGGLYVYHP